MAALTESVEKAPGLMRRGRHYSRNAAAQEDGREEDRSQEDHGEESSRCPKAAQRLRGRVSGAADRSCAGFVGYAQPGL